MPVKHYDWEKPAVQDILTKYCKKTEESPANLRQLISELSKELDRDVKTSIVYNQLKKIKNKLLETETTPSCQGMAEIDEAAKLLFNSAKHYCNTIEKVESHNQQLLEVKQESLPSWIKNKYTIVEKYTTDLNNRLQSTIITVKFSSGYHQYSKINKQKDIEYYCCLRCGRITGTFGIFYQGHFYLKNDKVHICTPITEKELTTERTLKEMKINAKSGMAPYKAWEEGKAIARKTGTQSMVPAFFQVQRGLRKIKAKSYPKIEAGQIPQEFHNYPVNFEGIEERWLLLDTKDVTVFCSNLGLEAMATANVLCADGTFKTCPHPYYQVFFVRAFHEGNSKGDGEWITVLMALMTGKGQKQYDIIVRAILDGWKTLGLEPQFDRIHVDYEVGLQNSLEKLNGHNKVYGCFFHYSQSIINEVRRLHLKNYYEDKEGKYKEIRAYIKALIALPLLPKEDVRVIWKEYFLKEPNPSSQQHDWPTKELAALKEYMNNWLTKEFNRWTFWGLGRIKNSNSAESHNAKQLLQYPQKPSLPEFLENEQKNFQNYDDRFEQIKSGTTRFKPRKKRYVKLDESLQVYEAQYKDDCKQAVTLEEKVKVMHEYLVTAGELFQESRKKVKGNRKSEKVNDSHLIESDPEDSEVDLNIPENSILSETMCSPDIIDSLVKSISRDPWIYIVPTETSLRKICGKFNLKFEEYPFRNSRGVGNVHLVKKISTHDVLGDGNCGFRAMSYALTGSERSHIKIRKLICDFIITNDIHCFNNIFPEAKSEAALKRVCPEGSKTLPMTYWMNGKDLFAGSILLGLNILVLNSQKEWQIYNASIENGFSSMKLETNLPTILLDNSSSNHFTVITHLSPY